MNASSSTISIRVRGMPELISLIRILCMGQIPFSVGPTSDLQEWHVGFPADAKDYVGKHSAIRWFDV